SLMAKRVSPRNMKREMAWLCPSVLECGSSVSGSLAAMLRIFFCASAGVGATRPFAATTETITRNMHKQSRRGCAMDFSSFFEDRHVEGDSNMTTSVESVQDGSWGGRSKLGSCGAARPCLENGR